MNFYLAVYFLKKIDLFVLVVLGIKCKALHIQGKNSTSEPHPQLVTDCVGGIFLLLRKR